MSSIRNNELTKYLNYCILKKNRALLLFLKDKYRISNTDSEKVLEEALNMLQDDDEINFDSLINEQLHEFYLV